MPPAARVTDMHTCPMVNGIVPHVGGPILPPGAPTVLIEFLPAATVTSQAICVGPPDVIVRGSAGVFINYMPAARMGDNTAHGGVIVSGAQTVMIGEIGSPSPGAGGAGAVMMGLAVSGATELQQNPSSYAQAASDQSASGGKQNPLARLQVAKVFYDQTGWPTEKKENHLRGIDFSQPVEVVTLPAGTELLQWVDPHQAQGNYFDGDAPPEKLGLYPESVQPRVLKLYRLARDTQLLRSTAAAIRIDWVKDKASMVVPGGATQYFALPSSSANFIAESER